MSDLSFIKEIHDGSWMRRIWKGDECSRSSRAECRRPRLTDKIDMFSGIRGGWSRGGVVGVHLVGEGDVFGNGHGEVRLGGDRFVGCNGGWGPKLFTKGAFHRRGVVSNVGTLFSLDAAKEA